MKNLKYLLLLFIGIGGHCSYGQLTLSSTLATGQYYNPVSIHASVGTIALGGTGNVHLFINNTPISHTATYTTKPTPNILSNEAGLGQTGPDISLAVGKTPCSYGVSPTGSGTY